MELNLPLTGIIVLEEVIEVPNLNGIFCESDHRCIEFSHFEKHYASQLALRRLCANLHDLINECTTISFFTNSAKGFTLSYARRPVTILICVFSDELRDGYPRRFW
jgi:hypothetical protein